MYIFNTNQVHKVPAYDHIDGYVQIYSQEHVFRCETCWLDSGWLKKTAQNAQNLDFF